jgi:two-component system OmpR family sensor kinase/two-component system sensor histidine kinase BaeS
MNLTTRVLLAFALVIGVALLTASLLIGRSANTAYRGYLSGYQRQRMATYAATAGQIYVENGSWQAVQAWLDQAAVGQAHPGFRGGRSERNGQQQMQGGPGSVDRYVVVDATSGTPLAAPDVSPVAADRMALGVPVTGAPQAVIVPLGTTGGLGPPEQALLDQINRAILLSALAAGILALLLGGLLVASILRPLRKLETGVAQVAQGDFRARVEVRGGDEIGRLAQNFNSMAASLQQQEELRQRLVADIAHELRTPLSILQGNLQAILDGVYPLELEEIRTVYEETRLLSRLVNDLHELAQAEAGRLSLARQPVAAADVVDHMADSFRVLADSREITLESVTPDRNLRVDADPDRLQQMLHNLLGNAMRHTPADGSIQVGAAAADRDRVRFWVQDSGPGIPADVLPHVFDRFYRADSSRERSADFAGNAGLGLAIVKALAQAHGGEVGVASTVGQGALFWIELARVADDA